MKGDGGRAACLGEASKLKCPKAESLEKASRLRNSKAEDSEGKSGGLKEKGESVWMRRVLAEPGDQVMQRRGGGGGGGGQQGENLKRLEDQVQALKKQLEDERREQKKLLEVLTNVIKGEEPCVSLDKAENNLVNFHYSCTALQGSTQVVQQLQGALAAVESSGTETGQRGAPVKLKDRNDNRLVANDLLREPEGPKVKNTVSGGWYVVEKRKKKQTSNPQTSHHSANLPPATPVRWVPGGRGLLPTPPALASNFHTRKNLMY